MEMVRAPGAGQGRTGRFDDDPVARPIVMSMLQCTFDL